jgi:hypothetical protein
MRPSGTRENKQTNKQCNGSLDTITIPVEIIIVVVVVVNNQIGEELIWEDFLLLSQVLLHHCSV